MGRKLLDIAGQRFGRLTAIKPTDQRQGGCIIWECQCDCGNVTCVSGDSLRQNRTKSCGCLRKNCGKKNAKSLIGQRFGQLTVIKPTDKRSNKGSIIWECKCDCGNITYVGTDYLTIGHTKSCGCLNSIGEYNITQLLQKNNIPFIHDKRYFKDLTINTGIGRYDFILYPNTDKIRLIEFDGEQHFKSGNGWNTKERFNKTRASDNIKNEYALSHNIPLVRIPYTERDNITLDMLLGDKYLVKKGD